MKIKLFDSELKIMDLIWQEDGIPAKEIARRMSEEVGWSKTTTYTVLKKCVEKGAVVRMEPNFCCRAGISRSEAQQFETEELIDKMYGGSADRLIASLLDSKRLSQAEIERLKALIDRLE